MNTRTKFYCWLIGKLEHRKMTLQEIIDEWPEAASNLDDKELSTRTFHRYRDEIASMFGIEIECDKANGYRYYIHRDRYTDTEITDWMLSALRIASLGDTLKYHSKVVLEEAPQNTEYLDDILGAIDKHYSLRFRYHNPYAEEYDMEIVPMFVRLFHQRWYVIGARVKDEALRVLPFDRISNMEVVCKKHALSPETRKKSSPTIFMTVALASSDKITCRCSMSASASSFRRTIISTRCHCMRVSERYTRLRTIRIPTIVCVWLLPATLSKSYCGMAVRSLC